MSRTMPASPQPPEFREHLTGECSAHRSHTTSTCTGPIT